MYKVAILGYPIKHSLSPKILNYWMKKLNIKGEYFLLETPKKKKPFCMGCNFKMQIIILKILEIKLI